MFPRGAAAGGGSAGIIQARPGHGPAAGDVVDGGVALGCRSLLIMCPSEEIQEQKQ